MLSPQVVRVSCLAINILKVGLLGFDTLLPTSFLRLEGALAVVFWNILQAALGNGFDLCYGFIEVSF